MAEEKNESQFSTRSVLLLIVFVGIWAYLLFVMPLRIIFRNKENNFWDTMQPFSNMFGISALASYFCYGSTITGWFSIYANLTTGKPIRDELEGVFIFILCLSIVLTIASIVIAYLDVREARQ